MSVAAGPPAPGAERQPLPRVIASCDYCASTDATPETGWLRDEEGQHSLPPPFRTERFQFVRCNGCGLVYLRERPNTADLDIYYGQDYKCFRSYGDRGAIMKKLASELARRKLREILELMPAGNHTLLDYGCGSGTWLSLLREAGAPPSLRMVGTDVTEVAIDTARASGLEAYVCDELSLAEHLGPASVGVIHNFHVIEHVPSPKRMLERLRETLVPGGVLIGQTPNIASYGRRVWGDLWNQWHAPRHFVLFDHKTLARHAEAAGLEVVSISNSMSGATQWAQSALSWLAHRGNRPFRGIDEPLYSPLLLAFLPVVAVESAIGRTCHMDFVLRRPR